MKQTVNEWDFRDAFLGSDTYKNKFSYDGLTALFEWIEEYEESTGSETDFDMIAICCEFSEYENLEEFKESYSDGEVSRVTSPEQLEDWTTVIMIDDESFIIQDF